MDSSKARMNEFSTFEIRLTIVLLLGGLSFYLLDSWDQPLSEWIRQQELFPWMKWMNSSRFERGSWGLSDLPVVIEIGALFLALGFTPIIRRKFPLFLIKLNYLLFSGLALSAAVHLLKGLSSRTRPYELASQGKHFTPYYDINTWSLDGWGHGSFPSGHTASMIGLLALLPFIKPGMWRWLFASLIMIASFFMAWSRVATGAHWPTDTLAAVLLAIVMLEVIYSRVLQIPVQIQLVQREGKYPERLSGFEWKLLPTFLIIIGIPSLSLVAWSVSKNIWIATMSFFAALFAQNFLWKYSRWSPQFPIQSKTKEILEFL